MKTKAVLEDRWRAVQHSDHRKNIEFCTRISRIGDFPPICRQKDLAARRAFEKWKKEKRRSLPPMQISEQTQLKRWKKSWKSCAVKFYLTHHTALTLQLRNIIFSVLCWTIFVVPSSTRMKVSKTRSSLSPALVHPNIVKKELKGLYLVVRKLYLSDETIYTTNE